ncbi:hypothetical protein HPB47_019085 [Ixodes persulcatus]|uniref:Uncharacterized protein n=1 Tax=Ixodes persulcatus TaxID=34615 RepID=A0AC60QJ30_IXOPE|nr:hypothetical protein HPB47_019085 [Ixodes persulcatus]
MEGGPGFSGLLGMFTKNGPVGITKDGSICARLDALTEHTHVVYLDAPVGAGFSFTHNIANGLSKNLDDTSKDISEFLKQFLNVFSEYKTSDLYVGGESYGGRLAVGFANYISGNQNQESSDAAPRFNLKGVVAGSPFLGPLLETIDSSEFLFSVGMLNTTSKILFHQAFEDLTKETNRTIQLVKFLRTVFQDYTKKNPTLFQKLTGYNIHSSVLHTKIPQEFVEYKTYVNASDFKTRIHVGSDAVLRKQMLSVILSMGMVDFFTNITSMVQSAFDKYRVLIYGGQLDTIFPAINMDAFYNSLTWDGSDDFKKERVTWYSDDDPDYLNGYDSDRRPGESPSDDCGLRELVQDLCRKIEDLTQEVRSLRSDNESLRTHLARNTDLLRSWPSVSEASQRPSRGEFHKRPRPLSSIMTRPPRIDERHFELSGERHGSRGFDRGSVPALSDRRGYTGTDGSKTTVNQPMDADGFLQVVPRRRVKASAGSAKESMLHVVAKPPRKKALFVSRLHPETTCEEVSEIVGSVLDSQGFECTKLASRYDTYSSFHVSVNDEDFEKLVCPDLWPEGCLFRPFLGRLRLDDARSAPKLKPKQGEDRRCLNTRLREHVLEVSRASSDSFHPIIVHQHLCKICEARFQDTSMIRRHKNKFGREIIEAYRIAGDEHNIAAPPLGLSRVEINYLKPELN